LVPPQVSVPGIVRTAASIFIFFVPLGFCFLSAAGLSWLIFFVLLRFWLCAPAVFLLVFLAAVCSDFWPAAFDFGPRDSVLVRGLPFAGNSVAKPRFAACFTPLI
jgi:hypothetical protein